MILSLSNFNNIVSIGVAGYMIIPEVIRIEKGTNNRISESSISNKPKVIMCICVSGKEEAYHYTRPNSFAPIAGLIY